MSQSLVDDDAVRILDELARAREFRGIMNPGKARVWRPATFALWTRLYPGEEFVTRSSGGSATLFTRYARMLTALHELCNMGMVEMLTESSGEIYKIRLVNV